MTRVNFVCAGLMHLSTGHVERVFLFFSNRLGCLGSLLVSAVLSIVLLLVIRLAFG